MKGIKLLVSMSQAMMMLLLVCTVLVMLPVASAKRWMVGDNKGWTTNINYSTWIEGKNFYNGDWFCKHLLFSIMLNLNKSKNRILSCITSNCKTMNLLKSNNLIRRLVFWLCILNSTYQSRNMSPLIKDCPGTIARNSMFCMVFILSWENMCDWIQECNFIVVKLLFDLLT